MALFFLALPSSDINCSVQGMFTRVDRMSPCCSLFCLLIHDSRVNNTPSVSSPNSTHPTPRQLCPQGEVNSRQTHSLETQKKKRGIGTHVTKERISTCCLFSEHSVMRRHRSHVEMVAREEISLFFIFGRISFATKVDANIPPCLCTMGAISLITPFVGTSPPRVKGGIGGNLGGRKQEKKTGSPYAIWW